MSGLEAAVFGVISRLNELHGAWVVRSVRLGPHSEAEKQTLLKDMTRMALS